MAWDVTVMGAGIFGLACAWEMTRRGARVQVIDPNGVGSGASGGVVGALAPHVPENWNDKKAFQLDCLLAAQAFWAEVEAAGGGHTGYGRTGRLQPILDDHGLGLARARSETALALWGDNARWSVVPAASLGDWVPYSPTGWVIEDTLTARLHPAQTCAATAAALRAQGSAVVQDGTPEGPVLWATGVSGLVDLSRDLPRALGAGVKGQAAVLQAKVPPHAPQLFVEGLHVVPHADGTVAVGSTSERDYVSATEVDAALETVIERARAVHPALAEAPVIGRWAGVRPRARSRAPMLGPWPDHPGHFVANGGFKIGLGIAPGVARLMADLILDGVDGIPPMFRVEANL